MERKIAALFTLLSLGYLLASAQGEFYLSFLAKILPLLLLTGWVLLHIRQQGHTQNGTPSHSGQLKWLIAALLWSMIGDVLLAWDGQNLFVYGLAAFLVSHLFYLQCLRPLQHYKLLLLLPYGLYAAVVMSLMFANLGAMFGPVLLYMTVILLMSLATWMTRHSNGWLVAGGLSFILSDSLIGLTKFYQPMDHAGTAIMLTYYFAQFALVSGFLRRHTQDTQISS